MSNVYTPDNWVVVSGKVTEDSKPIYKVLGGWKGGYAQGDAWRLSSGITCAEDDGTHIIFHNHSGSQYICRKTAKRFSIVTMGVYKQIESEQVFEGQVDIVDDTVNLFELLGECNE